MMKLLALLQVKAGKFVIKESHGATLNYTTKHYT